MPSDHMGDSRTQGRWLITRQYHRAGSGVNDGRCKQPGPAPIAAPARIASILAQAPASADSVVYLRLGVARSQLKWLPLLICREGETTTGGVCGAL
jgi:hypothetical protein